MHLPTVVVSREVLVSWLTVSGYTKSQLANELGVSKGRISQLLTCRQEPSANLIARLLLLTRLPFDRLFQLVRDVSQPAPASAPPQSSRRAASDGNGRTSRPVHPREASARKR